MLKKNKEVKGEVLNGLPPGNSRGRLSDHNTIPDEGWSLELRTNRSYRTLGGNFRTWQ